MPAPVPDDAIAAVLMDLAEQRGAGASFCPSEAARALAVREGREDWRSLMADVRRVAAGLPLVATQGGVPVDPVAALRQECLEQSKPKWRRHGSEERHSHENDTAAPERRGAVWLHGHIRPSNFIAVTARS